MGADIAAVIEIASGQHGAVSTEQLRRCGLTARAAQHAVAAGWLRFVERNVAVVAGSPDSWHRRLQVGLLMLGRHAWISHEAAAALHRFDRSVAGSIEFSVPRSNRPRAGTPAVHTTAVAGAVDIVIVDGFRCSSPTRTIIDLAASAIPVIRLEAAIDSAVRSGATAPIVLERRLADLRGSGRAGARILDRLLIDSGGESMLERRFLALVREAGLPRPETQVVQRSEERHVARVDFLFRQHGVVVEVTGRLGHSSPTERGRDAQRRNELTDLGLRVYEYTWAHVTHRPTWVVANLRVRLSGISGSARSGG